ncbi:hypothetical protein ACHAWF_013171 [Thalassiosira exigua]
MSDAAAVAPSVPAGTSAASAPAAEEAEGAAASAATTSAAAEDATAASSAVVDSAAEEAPGSAAAASDESAPSTVAPATTATEATGSATTAATEAEGAAVAAPAEATTAASEEESAPLPSSEAAAPEATAEDATAAAPAVDAPCECAPPSSDASSLFDDGESESEAPTTVLKVLTINFQAGNVEDHFGPAFERHYEERTGGTRKAKVDVSFSKDVAGFGALFEEILTDARLESQLFDVYLTPPSILGSVVKYGGFADMRDYISENYLGEWLDLFPGYRDIIATYDGSILMMPLDGDLLHLYYNKDVLSHYDLAPPRTWDEYVAVAEAVHGKVFPLNNKTLVGSCVGRMLQCAGPYWETLVLSSMTQTRGSTQGHLFDSKTMKPLTDDALKELLRIFELQNRYGHRDEFGGCNGINVMSMNGTYADANGTTLEEECVLTYNWGGSFQRDVARGKLGVAKTPGSTRVLDRETGTLVPCDKERCPHATYYDDLGFVNYAPYAAFGGWSGAVSANIPKEKQRLAMDFLAFTASKEESSKYIIQEKDNVQVTGFDPFRRSHNDLEAFVAKGYDRDTTKTYLASITESLGSPNLVVDIRFPEATALVGAMDENVVKHLQEVRGETDEAVLAAKRVETLNDVNAAFADIIEKYNARGDTEAPLLEQYQRLRGVFVTENEDRNLIGNVRAVGWALGGLVVLMALGFTAWVAYNRKNRVVKMSQPMFLSMVCFGVLVLSSAIFPLGIDDSVATVRGCDAACASIPWLVSTGFSFVFAALFSKLWRLNRVFSAAKTFRAVVLKEKDVLRPLAVLMSLNFVLLLSWTLVDPLRWKRVYVDELTSYGRCVAEGSAWKGFISALALLNFVALLVANIQAYKARFITDELAESKYIGLTTLSMLQIFVVGVPLLVIVYDNPSAYFFVWTGIIFVVSTSILMLIFAPKVMTVRERKNQGPTGTRMSQWSSNQGRGSAAPSMVSEMRSRASHLQSSVQSRASSMDPNEPASSLPDKGSELVFRQRMDDLKALVLEEHHIDIASVISKVQDGADAKNGDGA